MGTAGHTGHLGLQLVYGPNKQWTKSCISALSLRLQRDFHLQNRHMAPHNNSGTKLHVKSTKKPRLFWSADTLQRNVEDTAVVYMTLKNQTACSGVEKTAVPKMVIDHWRWPREGVAASLKSQIYISKKNPAMASGGHSRIFTLDTLCSCICSKPICSSVQIWASASERAFSSLCMLLGIILQCVVANPSMAEDDMFTVAVHGHKAVNAILTSKLQLEHPAIQQRPDQVQMLPCRSSASDFVEEPSVW